MKKGAMRNLPQLSQSRVVMIAIMMMLEMMNQRASRAHATARSLAHQPFLSYQLFNFYELCLCSASRCNSHCVDCVNVCMNCDMYDCMCIGEQKLLRTVLNYRVWWQ